MNGLITRLILVFVGSSLAFTLLPLLQSGGDAPLIAVLDRGTSLVVYAAFLILFAFFVLPHFLRRDHVGQRLWPWIALGGYVLLFAAIPLVFTAYISGVSASGLVRVGALTTTAIGFPVLVARLTGGRAVGRACALLGGVLLFALPGVALYLESVGRAPPVWIVTVSPWHWLHRIGILRQVPEPLWPFLALMGTTWAVAALPGLRRRQGGAAVAALLVIAGLGAWTEPAVTAPSLSAGAEQRDVRVESLAGGFARAGLRTPLRITFEGAGGDALVSAGLDAVRVPRDGAAHEVLVAIDEGARQLTIEMGERTDMRPLPVTLVADDHILVGWLGEGEAPEEMTRPQSVVVALGVSALPPAHGALEAYDFMVCPKSRWETASAEARRVIDRWVALGGKLERSDDPSPEAPVAPYRSTALDDGLTRTFAPPDWQEMDLSALLLFAVIYHCAFLLAFLLPLLLDSGKSLGVYLVSVGFVVVVIAGLAWHVLGDIFLRDNQVYTHAITIMVADGGDEPRVASRQFLCFASMSEEERDLRFAEDADLTVYRSPFTPRQVIRGRAGDAMVLESVLLDRFEHKFVVRVDRVAALPVSVTQDAASDGGFTIAPRADVADPLGIRAARVSAAWQVSGGRITRRLEPLGEHLVDAGLGAPADLPAEVQLHVGKLLGHFAPIRPSWLLVRLDDLPRADSERQWLWSRDLGGWLLLPLRDS
ncbi:MAG: hypothetical protein HRU14_07920 [Planctomycetes bacterium]|nr:hypothetical protein [Planctomycetota bacterium]